MHPIIKRSLTIPVAGAVVAAGTALSHSPANADTQVNLPRVQAVDRLSDGSTITVTADDRARISPSMGATPLHRNVWVSGTVRVEGSNTMTNGRLEAGYIIGCQVALGASTDAKSTSEAGDSTVEIGASAGGDITLGPGDVERQPILTFSQKDENGDTEQVGYYTFNGHSASLTFTDKTFGLTGCAGYAQARLYVNVTAYEKGSKTKTTLYGKPFSIG
ncbi:MspA family porin [Gordonia sp. SCSIO 19800]|uniref:MspA family porin n=1 Tax=Gordonia sp. SCSIO 19800 TaxID=2826926 RepID=UPI001B843B71|nr:MspA family porin [Gordonia sp. SCSIO 19800]MBR7192579.1 MspA family porin [Gordonia sp. SCSIO 19800]